VRGRRGAALAVLIALAAIAAIVLLIRASSPEPTLSQPLRAQPAARFLDSVGVNVHVSYYDTSYGRFPTWAARLRRLGVHHVRDGLVVNDPTYASRHLALARAGIKSSFIAGDRNVAPADYVKLVAGPLRPAADQIEGPNEPDLQFGPDWAAATRTFTQQLHDAWSATPSLRSVPLVGPSFVTDGARAQVPGAGRLWQVENLHSYGGGRPPETHLPRDIAASRSRAPKEPVEVTEMGYQTSPKATTTQPGVTEATAAAYVPRDYLEAFAAGARRSYLYELADEKPDPAGTSSEQHFGLLRQDLSPKPAFTTLQRLLADIRDSPGAGDRRPVAVRSTADVRSLLLDRPDGSRALVLWRRVDAGATAAPVSQDRVRVSFQGSPEDLSVRPLDGRRASSALDADGVLELSLGAGAVVVSFR
jgi:hypothetical protein